MTTRRTYGARWLWATSVVALGTVASLVNGSACGAMDEMSPSDGGGAMEGSAGDGGVTGAGGGLGPDAGPEVVNPEMYKDDKCPDPNRNDFYPLSLGILVPPLEGNTNASEDDYSSFCGGGANGERADVVYFMEAADRGTLTIGTLSSLDQPVVYVESECGVRTTYGMRPDQLPCLDTPGQEIRLGVTKGQRFYVIVEGAGSDGDYRVDVELTEPTCGDGVVNPAEGEGQGEQCDLGSGGAGGAGPVDDGCDDDCRFELPEGDEDLCPGIPVTAGLPVQGHTLGFQDNFQPPCGAPGGPDRLFFLALQQGDQLHLAVEADFDVVLAVMEKCDEKQPSHCQDSAGLSTEETLDFTAPTTGAYIIAIDGYDGASWGSFTLTATKS